MKKEALLAAALVMSGCANPSIVNVNRANMTGARITKVYVPRFEGNPEYVEEGTDMFVSELESKSGASVTQGDALRQESADVLAGGNLAPSDMALTAASRAGAQAVIMGKVSSYDAHGTLNGFASVRVISVSTRKIIATIHRPSGMLIGNEHQAVLAAVRRTADDVADAIR